MSELAETTFLELESSTKVIHDGYEPQTYTFMPVVPPIILSTTYKQPELGKNQGHEYSRISNPTRSIVESSIASLENGKYGLCFSSGLGAVTSVLFLLKTGDHILCIDDAYGGTNYLVRHLFNRMGIETSFADASNIDEFVARIRTQTKLVWLESPTNPTLKLCDLKLIKEKVYEKNSETLVVVDNTFATPCFQKPLDFGIDIVMESVTKYLNGHSDVVMGALVTNNEDLYKRLKTNQIALGAVPSPFDCYLSYRGIKTVHLRMKEHMFVSMEVARFLDNNSRIEKIFFPPLESHPQHDLYKKQMTGFSGMLSLRIRGGLEETKVFLKSLKIFSLAGSLGGYESLIQHPASMTHATVPKEDREKVGIYDNFVRLSIGLESPSDLINDLEQALVKAIKIDQN